MQEKTLAPPHDADTIVPDYDKIDEAVLPLLLCGAHDFNLAWKCFNAGAMERLHAKGLISDPKTNAKSVVLLPEGRAEAVRLFKLLFARS